MFYQSMLLLIDVRAFINCRELAEDCFPGLHCIVSLPTWNRGPFSPAATIAVGLASMFLVHQCLVSENLASRAAKFHFYLEYLCVTFAN